MSNHFNNILDGEELIQNSSLQLSFSPRWAKIERLIYYTNITLLALFGVIKILIFQHPYFIKNLSGGPGYFIIFIILLTLLIIPIIYIRRFKKFRKNHSTNFFTKNSRISFLIITPILFLTSFITFLASGFLIYLDIILLFLNEEMIIISLYILFIVISLFLSSAFLSAYYIYSIRFFYRINDTSLDNLFN